MYSSRPARPTRCPAGGHSASQVSSSAGATPSTNSTWFTLLSGYRFGPHPLRRPRPDPGRPALYDTLVRASPPSCARFGALATTAATGCGTGQANDRPAEPFTVDITAIPVGGGTVFPDPATVATQPQPGQFRVLSAICLTVATVENDTIICPCHDSRFHISDGTVTHGPAQQPLTSARSPRQPPRFTSPDRPRRTRRTSARGETTPRPRAATALVIEPRGGDLMGHRRSGCRPTSVRPETPADTARPRTSAATMR
ncbi:Rieske (2Fe-2S) protein [Nocardia sp. NBC_00508]|uniref:Rieske (2Fe-2S) protein n=1 Tax=Nocardia sp. NBC_00508 TaxID=2975992 RepID=UPI002E813938|nr:Rieske (2Fe-2S) protein [Nocardia sp. NBC_00508]WUD67328.1 Rieske (2Fe-2S) protein [Nocardia sp. NBC_00508]